MIRILAATYNDVKVNGVSLGDGKYLASNSATDSNYSNTEPSSYVAWYKDGTLTLNGYKGTGIVLQGAPAADLIIKLIGDNTITTTTNEVGIQGNSAAGSITITADSGSNGNLTIDMTHSTRPVFGINGYANSVTITGSADVKITAVATATDQESFGIKSSKAVSILDSASVGITCKTPNSTSRSDTCNGIYSDTGVTINTDGTIQIDVHEAGDEAYSYGINSMGTLTLTKVGGMTVKWKKAGVQGSPLLPSSASFDPTAYDTHKDTTDTTNCVATYMPKGTTPTTYTVSFDANGGTGTMADVTDISGEYTLPANGFTAPVGKQFKAWSVGGVEKAAGDKITVTANTTVTAVWEPIPVTTYDLTTSVNGGHGTISASKTGLTAGSTETITFNPEVGYEIDTVTVNGTATSVSGNTLNVTMNENKTVVVTYKAIEYNITVTDGKATIGAGSEISKAAEGTAVTLTANAAPSDKVFDKWEVISGSITLADANSATTTFTMPASAVSVKATYKNAPHTHTYNQETVKPEALKTPADCTGNAVYFKSCSCGAISTTDAFVAMNTALGHAYGSDWKYDSTNHWHECSRCHDKKYEAAHDYGSDNVCDTCGYYKTVPHTHNLTLVAAKAATCTTAGNSAYYTCDGCDKWFADATGSVEITDKTSVKIPAPGHTAGTEWKSDDTNHWHECSRCHDKKDEAAHDYGSDNVCDTCGYYKTVPHTHNLTLVAAKAATCTEGGKEAYYKCEGCGKFYEDVLGTKEITDLASWGNIAKIAHTTKQTVTKATPTANGKIVNYCSVCKKTLSTTVIPKASSIKLKATSLTYNGKVRTPKVIVKDRTGKTLVKNTDYTVSYAKGRKYVGKYAVKITFKGKYSGTKMLYFTIKPKATSISSLTAGSKKFTVKWKKQATQTTGYQVQYSASSKFSKAKTVTVGKNTTVSKKISKLSGKKKYYVRVRTYKTVKINGKSIRIYSGWSKAKTVTTKK
ncbi:InlB B-repeat-containing protein [Thomasclavelia ramosa]|uniref:InlB B-repeat-containing protein n=1 Tax=Thomasclavelia ramosa TaxID=1547 RepID=UPI001F1AD9FB|nr:fibronectin type III domain-containing protein [Thomasclavelia ramosa]